MPAMLFPTSFLRDSAAVPVTTTASSESALGRNSKSTTTVSLPASVICRETAEPVHAARVGAGDAVGAGHENLHRIERPSRHVDDAAANGPARRLRGERAGREHGDEHGGRAPQGECVAW
jgi:hypothetical protein